MPSFGRRLPGFSGMSEQTESILEEKATMGLLNLTVNFVPWHLTTSIALPSSLPKLPVHG